MFQPDEPRGPVHIVILWIIIWTISYAVIRCDTAKAEEWKLLDLEKFNMEFSRLDPNARDPYAYQYTGRWKDRAAADFRLSIFGPLYWDNYVHTETIDTGAVKTVGWKWEAGLRISKYLSVFSGHHSRHIMDESTDTNGDRGNTFPVENSFGIRLRIVEEHSNGGIFK